MEYDEIKEIVKLAIDSNDIEDLIDLLLDYSNRLESLEASLAEVSNFITVVQTLQPSLVQLETLIQDVEGLKDKNNQLEEKINECCPDQRNIEEELQYLKDENFTAKKIASRYYKTKVNDTGFSTTDLYLYVGGQGNPTEKVMSEFIYGKLNN